jgi:hypothetical protein
MDLALSDASSRRAVPLRRRRPRLPQPRRPRAPPDRFLGEVEHAGLVGVAPMRMATRKAGRAALGAAAAAGVKHMAQRFIVGEDPKAALGDLRDSWKDGSPPPWTCSARRR